MDTIFRLSSQKLTNCHKLYISKSRSVQKSSWNTNIFNLKLYICIKISQSALISNFKEFWQPLIKSVENDSLEKKVLFWRLKYKKFQINTTSLHWDLVKVPWFKISRNFYFCWTTFISNTYWTLFKKWWSQ